MDLVLKRVDCIQAGIFGTLSRADTGEKIAVTLERAYPNLMTAKYAPKVPPGTYKCVRGEHELHSGPIETFEVTGVPGHSGILFHCGNLESASEGCILLGIDRMGVSVIHSRVAFYDFSELQKGLDSFTLTVEN